MSIETFESFSPSLHPEAFVHANATVIGEVEVGAESTLWPGTVLRGDQGKITIGRRTSTQDNSVAHGTSGMSEVRVGDECTVGHRVVLHGCSVGNRCLIGMGSVLLDNVEIGDDSFVAAGSLIPPNKKFPPGSFILGSPAKRVRDLTPEEREWIQYSWKSYVDLCGKYRARGR